MEEEEIILKLTKGEANVLKGYIEFMEEFDDDPDFRDHALSAGRKLKKAR